MKVNYSYNVNYKYLGSIFVMRNGSLSFMRVYFLPIQSVLKTLLFDQLVHSNGIVTRFFECQAATFDSTSSRHSSGKSLHVVNNSKIIVLE